MKIDQNIIGYGAVGRAFRTFLEPTSKVVFFCVKAFDLEEALFAQQSLWPENIPFVTFSNGYILPIIEKVQKASSQRCLRVGMTTMGASLSETGEIRVYSEGSETMWGLVKSIHKIQSEPTLDEKHTIEQNSGWSWQNDMTPVLCKKWIFNTTINTICAAHSLKANGLMKNHKTLTESVFGEAFELSKKLWGEFSDVHVPDKLLENLWGLIQRTSDNENSMARDVRLGRKTEKDYLSGVALNFDGFTTLKKLHFQINT